MFVRGSDFAIFGSVKEGGSRTSFVRVVVGVVVRYDPISRDF